MRFPFRPSSRAALVLALLTVAACEMTVEQRGFPELTYDHLPKLKLDVSRVDFVEAYQPPLSPPHIEHLFPTPPAAAVRRWVDDRLGTVGVQRTARVTLEDASAIAIALEPRSGVVGWFWVDQAERVDARINLTVEILDGAGKREAFTAAEVKRSRTLPEDVTLAERDEIYFELTEALMNDLNATLEQNIREYLGKYVR